MMELLVAAILLILAFNSIGHLFLGIFLAIGLLWLTGEV